MYGMPVQDRIETVCEQTDADDLLMIVGGEKVPTEVFDMADYNIAVGNQPHSEVAAVAVFLHDYFGGDELDRDFADADIDIVPQENGKKTRES
jgi:tRNA (cytidine56-2'-O)-methyltransferase